MRGLLQCLFALPYYGLQGENCFLRGKKAIGSVTVDELCSMVQCALRWHDAGLSPDLRRGLLLQPTEDSAEESPDVSGEDAPYACTRSLNEPPLIFAGLPRRPYYREVARRLFLLVHHGGGDGEGQGEEYAFQASTLRPLMNAHDLGMSENSPAIIPPPPRWATAPACAAWLRQAGDEGVLELLGMRHTVGTEVGLLPPDWSALRAATKVPYRLNAGKPPLLTVAGRARCKHAHRGTVDQFFGEVKGGTDEKNEAAEEIILELLHKAVWVNIHIFGNIPTGTPVLEVRVASGYGARWTGDWSGDRMDPAGVEFRGFLEPQMEDGHDKRWRH